jgi:hypothetical protein
MSNSISSLLITLLLRAQNNGDNCLELDFVVSTPTTEVNNTRNRVVTAMILPIRIFLFILSPYS